MKIYFVILVLVIVSCAQLFRSGFYTSPDGENHLVRTAYFSQAIKSGNFLPGWVNELNNFKGYPIFFFVYPLPYYLNSFWSYFGFGVIDSLKFSLLITTFTGALFQYLWIKSLTQSKVAALSAVIIYILTPYRFVDLYVRAAFGELVFLGILPAAFWATQTGRKKTLSLVIALMVLSHLQLSVMFIGILLAYSLILRKNFKTSAWYIFLGIALSSFFWLPATRLVTSTKFMSVHQFVPVQHLASLKQVIYSPWGFGFSHPGPFDEMSFQLGFANWLIVLLGMILVVKKFSLNILFWLVVTMGAIVLITSSPFGFWNFALVQSIQFPWRLLGVTLFSVSALAGLVIGTKSNNRWMVIGLVLISIYANRNHIRINATQFEGAADSYFLESNTTTTATPDEFMPTRPRKYFENDWSISVGRMISLLSLGILCLFAQTPYFKRQ